MYMCRVTSGRRGYDLYGGSSTNNNNNNDNNVTISRSELILMLKYENELRLSAKWLSLMEKEISLSNNNSPSPLDGYMTDKISATINNLQIEVVKKFGYNKSNNEINSAIKILRSAVALYPNDIQIKNAANYLKYNKINKGILKINDNINNKIKNWKQIKFIKVINNINNNDNDDIKMQNINNLNYNTQQLTMNDIFSSNQINLILSTSVT